MPIDDFPWAILLLALLLALFPITVDLVSRIDQWLWRRYFGGKRDAE